jgi:hypothetical protein
LNPETATAIDGGNKSSTNSPIQAGVDAKLENSRRIQVGGPADVLDHATSEIASDG